MDFMRNDFDLMRGERWFQLITGPNMSGKSTFI
jgi:DNA mismatch repair protein MSH2